MNVALVNPPNHRIDLDDLAPPLGLLKLAEVLLRDSNDCEIFDFNLESCSTGWPSPEDFYRQACGRILACDPDVVCFTSMGINSHVCLEVARRLKAREPRLSTVFGGPHFSSIATSLCDLFPWVDYVVKGEGEAALSYLLYEDSTKW